MFKKYIKLAIFATLIYLTFNLVTLPQYGLTWDYHFHFFTGAKFLGLSAAQAETRQLPYAIPDPRGTYMLPYGPLVSIIPYASFQFFHKNLNLLPEDVAYNLPGTIVGSVGPLILFLFLIEATGSVWLAALSAVFMALTPRYLGDLHNNMKDIPSAVVFCLNIWLIWRLFTYKRLRDLMLAALGFALAFNILVNSIFIPAIAGVWLIVLMILKKLPLKNFFNQNLKILLYFILAPLFAYLLWAYFWKDPIGEIKLMFETFGVGTNNIEVLLNGRWFCSGSTVPLYYPYEYLAITTPLPILLFFLIGLIGQIRQIRKNPLSSLLLLWFFLPLTRYLIPRIGVIDGIRHFEEVVFPLAAIAAIGVTAFFALISQIRLIRQIRLILLTLLLISLIAPLVLYHPYEITYFNELVGGSRGAMGKFDLDYWGTSQKQAVLWLNNNAPLNSKVYMVMAADVASAYLRPDLLARVNNTNYDNADYVVVLNRQSFFYRYFYLWEYFLRRKPIFTVTNQGVPLTWVFDNHAGLFPRAPEWWAGTDPCIQRYW